MMKINGQDKNRLGGVSLRSHRDFRLDSIRKNHGRVVIKESQVRI